MDFTILVNKENTIAKDFVPSDLVIVDENENNFHNYLDPLLKQVIDKCVFYAFLRLQKKAREFGFELIIDSGYRSFDYQAKILEEIEKQKGTEYAKKYVALPRTSEHQTGLAIDIAAFHSGIYDENLNKEEIDWLKNNAYKFGFILRYPEGKESITGYNYEPWHYRYVGDLSILLYKCNITLEEYYLKKEYYDSINFNDNNILKKL